MVRLELHSVETGVGRIKDILLVYGRFPQRGVQSKSMSMDKKMHGNVKAYAYRQGNTVTLGIDFAVRIDDVNPSFGFPTWK